MYTTEYKIKELLKNSALKIEAKRNKKTNPTHQPIHIKTVKRKI